MTRSFVSNAFRGLFMFLDWAIYNLVSWLMQAIFDLAALPGNTFQDTINNITTKIYTIVAIFMVFKVIVSLLTYLVNPDTISDKQQGAGKLIIRIVLVFAMLIAEPTVFKLMYEVQEPVLKTLPKLILTKKEGGSTSSINVEQQGTTVAWNVFNTFYYTDEECSETGTLDSIQPSFITDKNNIPSNVFSLALADVNDECSYSSYHDSSRYMYHYTPLVSTIAGGFLCYCLIGIAITIAIRSFKLIILQLLAPIPIISYIDPKSGKDGTFNKWVKMTLTTWLELFLNLAVVYLVIYLVSEVITSDNGVLNYALGLNGVHRGLLVIVFMILGLFAFARQAPKFIMDALGIKSEGGIGKAIGLSTASLGSIGAARASYAASRAADDTLGRNHNVLRNAGAALFGGIGGYAAGSKSAMDAKDHNTRAVLDAMSKRNAKAMELGRDGGTFFGAVGSEVGRFFTGQTAGDRLEAEWKAEEEAIKYEKQKNAERKTIMDRASSKGLESLKTSTTLDSLKGDLAKYNGLTANAAKFNSALDAAQARGASSFTFNGKKINMDDAGLLQHEINDGNIADYAEQSLKGTIDDSVITAADARFASANDGTGVERVFGGSTGLKASYGKANNEISSREMSLANQKNSGRAQAARANAKRFK